MVFFGNFLKTGSHHTRHLHAGGEELADVIADVIRQQFPGKKKTCIIADITSESAPHHRHTRNLCLVSSPCVSHINRMACSLYTVGSSHGEHHAPGQKTMQF
ncbi:unnamed protein product [Cuscuta europaea]|uniref:Uncharacterized protein n=1 Tax=Cuscuta europaea TaxID=41803 RepID=A0A9P1EBB2_CUSEU|nr:unnamed protein product [Cuscuta europaea]